MAWKKKGGGKTTSLSTDKNPILSSGVNHMSQANAFLSGEGNQYYQRNKEKPLNQNLLAGLKSLPLSQRAEILEVGCGDGRYLASLGSHYDCFVAGVEPSVDAIAHASPGVSIIRDDALHGLQNMADESFDLIVFGFCLYLVDRRNLLSIVGHADRVLRVNGFLAIHDFEVAVPQITPYLHKPGLFSYKMNYADLWLANPAYRRHSKTITSEDGSLVILRKDTWENRCAYSSSPPIQT